MTNKSEISANAPSVTEAGAVELTESELDAASGAGILACNGTHIPKIQGFTDVSGLSIETK